MAPMIPAFLCVVIAESMENMATADNSKVIFRHGFS